LKKIVILIVVVAMMIPMGIALADDTVPANQAPTTREQMQQIRQQIQDRAAFAAKVRELNLEIRKTHIEFLELKLENNTLTREIRQAVAKLRKEKIIDVDTLKEIIQKVKNVSSIKSELKSTIGEIRSQWQTFRQTRMDKDYSAAIANLENILSIQKARIENLKKIN